MKKYLLLLLILFTLPAYAVNTPVIIGIKGAVLKNVKARIAALPSDQALTRDNLKEQINQALLPYGYFAATITIEQYTPDTLQVRINPGKPIPITKCSIRIIGEGQNNPQLNDYIQHFPIKSGDPLLIEPYNKAKQGLLNIAQNQGFLRSGFNKAEIQINREKYTAEITLIFDTGALYYFGQVQFNPTNISPELLNKYIPFKSGQPYSTKQILVLNQQLSNSGYFNSVAIQPSIDTDTAVPILVNMQPVSKYTYDYSLGYGTDTGVRGRMGMHIIPVNNSGHTLSFLGQGSYTQNLLQAQYVIPGNHPTTDNYAITGSLSNLDYDSGHGNNLLMSASQNHKLLNFQRNLSINTLFERFRYTDQPKESKNTLFPKAVFSYNQVSSPLFSPSGYGVTFTVLGANKSVLSDLNFTQAYMDAKAAYWLEPIRTRLYFHTIMGVTQTPNMDQFPISLALLLGGSQDLRGYAINSIPPGKITQYAGLEIQKETIHSWYLTGFLDTGNVYNPQPKNQLYDVGVGLMWVSPVGPIKIGVAQAVNKHFQRLEDVGPRLVINMGADL